MLKLEVRKRKVEIVKRIFWYQISTAMIGQSIILANLTNKASMLNVIGCPIIKFNDIPVIFT